MRARQLLHAFSLSIVLTIVAPVSSSADLCDRVVSLAPSVTETLFALELGERVVGVSRFCRYPPEAQTRAVVGGFMDLNIEQILSLRPTVVFGVAEFKDRAADLRSLGVRVELVDHRTVSGIDESIRSIGTLCHREAVAKRVLDRIESEQREVLTQVQGRAIVPTLLVVGGTDGGSLSNLYVSGRDGFYDGLIERAGGRNIVSGDTRPVFGLTLEAVVGLRPEVIIEVHPDARDLRAGEEMSRRAWSLFPQIPAVAHQRIFWLTEDFTYLPGPRYPKLLRRLAHLLHGVSE